MTDTTLIELSRPAPRLNPLGALARRTVFARLALLAHPFMTFAIMARIHWQALRLWLKRVPFFAKPAAPAEEPTR